MFSENLLQQEMKSKQSLYTFSAECGVQSAKCGSSSHCTAHIPPHFGCFLSLRCPCWRRRSIIFPLIMRVLERRPVKSSWNVIRITRLSIHLLRQLASVSRLHPDPTTHTTRERQPNNVCLFVGGTICTTDSLFTQFQCKHRRASRISSQDITAASYPLPAPSTHPPSESVLHAISL